MSAVAVDLALFLAGSAAIVAMARWWRPGLDRPTVLCMVALALLLLAPGLATTGHLTATDLVARWRPWSQTMPQRPPANDLLSDPVLQMLPFRTLVRERLLDLDLPLWAPELGTGQPLLANAQSAPFAPLHLAALALPPLRAMDVAAGWQTLIGLLLMALLTRHLGAGRTGSILAAVAWAWSSYQVVWLLYPLAMTMVWLPGVILGVLLVAQRLPRAVAGLVVCTAGAALSGHPETLLHTALVAGAVGAWCWWHSALRWALIRDGAVAAVLAFAVTAPVLLPILEALPESERTAAIRERPDAAAPGPFDPAVASLVLDPLRFGSPRDGNWSAPSSNYNEIASGWAGAIALALALAAALALRGWRLAVLLGGGAALGIALRVPVLYDAFVAIPGFSHGAHGRLRLVWVCAVALLAGTAVDRLADSSTLRRWLAATSSGLILALVWLGVPPNPWQRAWWGVAIAGLALALASAFVPRLGRVPLVAALIVELALLGWRYNPATPASSSLDPQPAVLSWMASAAADRADPPRVLAEEWNLLPNLAATAGLGDPRGNDPMRPAVAARFVGMRMAGSWTPGFHSLQPGGRYDIGLLDFLGVEYLLVPARRWVPEGWHEAYRGAGGKVLVNDRATPRFFVPERVHGVRTRDEAFLGLLTSTEPSREVWFEGSPLPATAQAAKVLEIEDVPNGYRLSVQVETSSLLASSVSWARGWRAQVDGIGRPVRRVGGAFLGVELEPGDRAVHWSYRPTAFTVGLGLATAALATLALAAARRRRRATPAPSARVEAAP